jgi:hypothetical protein
MTPEELIQAYGLTDQRINRALHHVQPKTVAAYGAAIEAFTDDDSAENFNACLAVERRIIREARLWRRLFRWLSRKLEVAYWLGASEARQEADERANGLIGRQANDW